MKSYWLVDLVVLLALTGAAPTVKAQQESKDGGLTSLIALSMLRGFDAECKILSEPQRRGLIGLIPALAQMVKLPAGALKDLERKSNERTVDCADKGSLEFYAIATKTLDGMLEEAGKRAQAQADDGSAPFADMLRMWRSLADSAPKGLLTARVGCFDGVVEGWSVVLCLTGVGDTVDVALTSGDKTITCQFRGGDARFHTGIIKTFSWVDKPNCGNAPMMQHVEILCDPTDSKLLDCGMTAYAVDNSMYVDPKTQAVLNGSLKMRRR